VTTIHGILAVAVLLGLAMNAALGWWWADRWAGYVLVCYDVREVREIFLPRAGHDDKRAPTSVTYLVAHHGGTGHFSRAVTTPRQPERYAAPHPQRKPEGAGCGGPGRAVRRIPVAYHEYLEGRPDEGRRVSAADHSADDDLATLELAA
jgi:hypothetical protein